MSAVDQALETQLSNIEAKTGKRRYALYADVMGQGMAKHGEMVAWAKSTLGLGHGDANTLVHMARKSVEATHAVAGDPLDEIYTGPKAHQRPIHEALMAKSKPLGTSRLRQKRVMSRCAAQSSLRCWGRRQRIASSWASI
ncbi:DUF4287 domain-containing protein [Maricaulaceae bacterium NA33B04]|nr:DUF4287 domain-containing protein [Maricaulaceae bacterium NA33B04]